MTITLHGFNGTYCCIGCSCRGRAAHRDGDHLPSAGRQHRFQGTQLASRSASIKVMSVRALLKTLFTQPTVAGQSPHCERGTHGRIDARHWLIERSRALAPVYAQAVLTGDIQDLLLVRQQLAETMIKADELIADRIEAKIKERLKAGRKNPRQVASSR